MLAHRPSRPVRHRQGEPSRTLTVKQDLRDINGSHSLPESVKRGSRRGSRGPVRSPEPSCWWCHEPLDEIAPYRGEATDVIELPGGVIVCTPACPGRPDGALVWRTGW